ncbi:hypothetical protein O3M35_006997 [Rhynocoris fuscipes]|uniref:Uncharacterized protein n=1 Tax=Rhynocoris fuscipes TaxID=488301 RepID=A0AAW1DGV5_9HEMI
MSSQPKPFWRSTICDGLDTSSECMKTELLGRPTRPGWRAEEQGEDQGYQGLPGNRESENHSRSEDWIGAGEESCCRRGLSGPGSTKDNLTLLVAVEERNEYDDNDDKFHDSHGEREFSVRGLWFGGVLYNGLSYEDCLRKCGMASVSERYRGQGVNFVNGTYDSPELLVMFSFHVPARSTRQSKTFAEDSHRTEYGKSSSALKEIVNSMGVDVP